MTISSATVVAGFWAACFWAVTLLGQAPAPSPLTPPPVDLPALRERLAFHLAQPRFVHAHWGVLIVSLDTGAAFFAHNSDKLFLPASNAKLFTAALVFARLGPESRIRTSLYSTAGPNRNGVLKGDLILYGRGDPSFAARLHDGSLAAALAPLVEALTQGGLREVRGDLVADESFFRGPPFGSGWEWDDLQYYYGAEVSALSVNDNAVEVVVKPGPREGDGARVTIQPPTSFLSLSNQALTVATGQPRAIRFYRPLDRNVLFVTGRIPAGDGGETETMSVHQPALWFGELFAQAMQQRGIHVTGRVRRVSASDRGAAPLVQDTLVELGSVLSPPLSQLVRQMMKPSQNLHAQLLLLQAGAAHRRESAASAPARVGERLSPSPEAPMSQSGESDRQEATSEEDGLQALAAFLREIGIAPGEALLEEGSGLSRHNLVTPTAVIKLLRYVDRQTFAQAFRDSLPIAGVDGTLQNRMRDTAAAGNARAKTGTLGGVHALSGYVTSAAGERLAFAILLNNFTGTDPNRPARADLDAIVTTLASLPWRSAMPNE